MGVARIFGLCFAFLFVSSVAASTIDVGPSNWRNYGPSATHTTGGVQSTFGQQVRLPPTISGPTRILPVSRNAVIPYGSIANGLRNFTRINPASVAASAAVTGLFLAVDWVFDQNTGEWMVYEEGELLDPELSLWCTFGTCGPTPDLACQAYADRPSSSVRFSHSERGGSNFHCVGTNGSRYATVLQSASCPAGSVMNLSTGICMTEGALAPLQQSDWADLTATLPALSADQVATAAGDTQRQIGSPLPGYSDATITGPSSVSGPETTSTSTDPVTGETTVTTTSTQTNISYGDTTITTTNTTTSTTYQNGQQTDTTVTTETPGELPVSSGGGAAGDWPGFCEWATVVCDWFDWTQEEPPPEQDLPALVDDDFYTERDISFGSKSCPEPYQVNLAPFMDTQVSVSFQPLCDFAGLIYYMVMAASYIIAAYISIGVARA